MNRVKIKAIFILLSIPCFAFANTDPSLKVETENIIDTRITKLIQSVDPSGMAFSTVGLSQKETPLPGTPFTVAETDLNTSGAVSINSIDLRIFSKVDPLPEEIVNAIRKELGSFNASVQISFEPLSLAEPTAGSEAASPQNVTENPGQASTTSEAPALSDFTNLDGWKKLSLSNPFEALMILLVACLGLGGLFLTVYYFALSQRNYKKMARTMENIAEAFRESDRGSAPPLNAQQQNENYSQSMATTTSSHSTSEASILDHFPTSGLIALMADAYWTKQDGYAAYLWRKLSMGQRKELLNGSNYMKEYVDFLVDVDEKSGVYHQDPYYLNPLPLNNIDMNSLSRIARDHFGLIAKLPKMRKQNLTIPGVEYLRLVRDGDKSAPLTHEDLAAEAYSMPRRFPKKLNLEISTVEEEAQILEMEGLTDDQKKQIPSLAWLARSEDSDIKEILDSIRAVELARAWIGPQEVLERLGQLVSSKKYALVQNYLDKSVTPDRASEEFKYLCKLGVDSFFSKSKEDSDAPETDQKNMIEGVAS